MSETLFGKARLALLAQLNALADKAIDLNSVSAVEQNVMDLEHGVEQLGGSVAERRAAVASVNTRIASTQAEIAKIGKQIDTLLQANQDDQALTLQAKLEGDQHLLDTLNAELKLDQDSLAAIENSYNELKAILADRQSRLVQLRETAEITREQVQARKTATFARDTVLSTASAASIDNIGAKIERKQAVENERLNMALTDLKSSSGQDAALAGARAALLARKAALMAGATKGAAS